MKKIKLTQGQFALVDDEDFEWLNQWKWQARWEHKTNSFYALRTERNGGSRRTVLMHREVMGTPKGRICDHINHDTLDNRKSNLRNVTNSQNLMNRKGASTRSSLGILGVQVHGNGYRAFIRVNGKQKNLPSRSSIEEAIADRRNAENLYFGNYRSNNEN